jgi:hypothetical protein
MNKTIYDKGVADGKYGFTYIDPQWTPEQLDAWVQGYKAGLRCCKPVIYSNVTSHGCGGVMTPKWAKRSRR